MATEEPGQPQSAPPEQVRVTAEELAQALARIEARQAEQARRDAEAARQQEATISIGQAVQELGLNVAPAEILAEIEAKRAQEARQMMEQLMPLPAPKVSAPVPVPLPQASAPVPAPAAEIANCPSCGRKLLARASALCSWCGARIDNPDYQAQAEAQRQALDRTERTQVESMAQEEAKYGVFGRLRRRAKEKGSGPPKPGLG